MPYNPDQHQRRSIRLRGYDYTQAGTYFITIVTQQRLCLFGDIVDGAMQANAYGNVVATTWEWLPQHYPYVHLDAWVLMPNHMHGIIILHNHPGRGGSRTAPTNAYDDDPPMYLATDGITAPTNAYDDNPPILPTTSS